MSFYVGIDPGSSSGGVAVLGPANRPHLLKLSAATETDIYEFLVPLKAAASAYPGEAFALIEKVSAMKGWGGSSGFKFGMSYGGLRMLLVCLRIPFEAISPGVWQQKMGCRSSGDKNVTKARAQELFPGVKVTHAVADALLLAELARRLRSDRSGDTT